MHPQTHALVHTCTRSQHKDAYIAHTRTLHTQVRTTHTGTQKHMPHIHLHAPTQKKTAGLVAAYLLCHSQTTAAPPSNHLNSEGAASIHELTYSCTNILQASAYTYVHMHMHVTYMRQIAHCRVLGYLICLASY
jgi:hypothetical protein